QRVELVAHFSRLRTYPFHAEEKVLMLHGVEFRLRLGMGTNTLSSMYKPLNEYRILRIQITPMDITNSERLHTKDNGPLQIEVPTSAYKTHSYLQTKISHKANETRVAKPTVSRYLLYKRDNRTRLWRPSPSRDYKRSDLTTKLEGLGSFLDQQCRSPQPSLLPSEPLHQKNGQAKNFRSDLQGIMLALRRTMEPRTSLHEGATSCEEDIEPSEESLEPEEVTEEEPQSVDFTVHALAGYSNP
ncbi:hypothetical protein GW17_00041655, partial [Ensete ventricosum]